MRYAVVIENAGSNFSAYVPDLPGCVATGTTLAETETAIREAIAFHLEGYVRMAHLFRLPRAKWSTSRWPPNKTMEPTR